MPPQNLDRANFNSYGLTCVRWIPAPMRRPDHHNEIQINLLRKGELSYLLGSNSVKLVRGRLTAFWAAIPHQITDYTLDAEYFVATLPLAWFLQCGLPDNLVNPLMHGSIVQEPNSDRADMDAAMFKQWDADLKKDSRVISEIVVAEMKTRMQRLALSIDPQNKENPPSPNSILPNNSLNHIERIVCYIAQNYMDTITAEDIGKAAGLHPNSAMRIFKKTFGMTLFDYLTDHRVFHAKRLIMTTDKKIVDVAFESGFNSISRFNQAFKRICNCTPRDYRGAHESENNKSNR